MAENVYSLLNADGIAFTVGLPNDNFRPGFLINLKFEERSSVYRMIRLFSPHAAFPFWAKRTMAKVPFGPLSKFMFVKRDLKINIYKHLEKSWIEELWQHK